MVSPVEAELPDYLDQPGPAGAPWVAVSTGLCELDVLLPADVPLATVLAKVIKSQGLAGAYFSLTQAPVSRLEYVIPARSNDDEHVAWYSEVHKAAMPGRIEEAVFVCGSEAGAPYYHVHGVLRDAHQHEAMGHFLPDACVLSQAVRVRGFGFCDAFFDRQPDPQTRFDLFIPQPWGDTKSTTAKASKITHEGQLLRIAPNTEISAALIDCCQQAGWRQASVYGMGSLIGAHFADGRVMNSFATEMLIRRGEVDLSGASPAVSLDIQVVGLDGQLLRGQLATGQNPVLITAELLLRRAA